MVYPSCEGSLRCNFVWNAFVCDAPDLRRALQYKPKLPQLPASWHFSALAEAALVHYTNPHKQGNVVVNGSV